MSPGNKSIDSMLDKIYEENKQMPDDFGHLTDKIIKKIRGPVETGYKELDEIIQKLDNDEIKIGPISTYGSNFSIHFIGNLQSKEVGYRESASENKKPTDELATISSFAIEQKQTLTAREIKYLLKFCDKIPILLNKAAKTGVREYRFKFPIWFRLFFWNTKRYYIYSHFMQQEMNSRNYPHVFSFDDGVVIKW